LSLITLQFVLGADWSSKLISWYGQGYGGYSHVDAVLSDSTLLGARSDKVGGQPPGVQIRPPNYEKWSRRCIVTLAGTQALQPQWETFLRSQVGLPYDKADIIGLIIGRPLMSQGHWICSALQTAALHLVTLFPDMPETPQQVPPNMLLFGVLAIGGKVSS